MTEPWEEQSRLLDERVLWLRGEITEASANVLIARLLYLDFKDHDAEVRLLIDSPGGSVVDALAVFDTLAYVKTPIATYAIGQVAGMAALFLAKGTRGRRYVLPGTVVALTALWSSRDGPTARGEIERLSGVLQRLYAEVTGQTAASAAQFMTDRRLTASEAVRLGLADAVHPFMPPFARGGPPVSP
jgi:ATP-dependent Clp protease protease subunit